MTKAIVLTMCQALKVYTFFLELYFLIILVIIFFGCSGSLLLHTGSLQLWCVTSLAVEHGLWGAQSPIAAACGLVAVACGISPEPGIEPLSPLQASLSTVPPEVIRIIFLW